MGDICIPKLISEKIDKLKKVRGIMLTGSRVLGKASKNSDWDFFVILEDGTPRWRRTCKAGNDWLEVFANDQAQIRTYFKENQKSGRGIDIGMFANGVIIKDDNKGTVANLIKESKKLWQAGPKNLSKLERQWIDYDIATYIQDLEDIIDDDNEELLLINHAVNEMVNYYYRLGCIWLPRPKDRLADFKRRENYLFGIIKRIQNSNDWKLNAKNAIRLGTEVSRIFKLKIDGNVYFPPEKTKISNTNAKLAR